MIDFFASNNFVNNANKAALIYSSKGKGSVISVDIGGEMLSSTYTEKLLGLHIMAVRVVEFSNGGYKIRKIFA